MSYTIMSEKVLQQKITPGGEVCAVRLLELNCDSASDLPRPEPDWAAGSACILLDTQDVKFLNSQGVWV